MDTVCIGYLLYYIIIITAAFGGTIDLNKKEKEMNIKIKIITTQHVR